MDDVKTSVDFLTMLNDFVISNYISEWQAGYITAMLNCQFDNSELNNEKVYKQLLLCIWSYMHKEEI